MTKFWCECWVLVLIFSLLIWVEEVKAAECDLAKIFRTPKDMSKVNFDHFEIVERNAFDRLEPTTSTTTEAPLTNSKTSRKNGVNVANAQVLLRFGGDDVHGSNHIMKIPPQCRHLMGAPSSYVHPPPSHIYYPQCNPHYYHPYPPPVPFVFPNYYFLNDKNEEQYLPFQLRQYFRKHSDFLSEEFVSRNDQSLRKIIGKEPEVKQKDIPIISVPNIPKVDVLLMRPRVGKPLDLSNEDIEKDITDKAQAKRSCVDENKCDENSKIFNTNLNNDISILLEEKNDKCDTSNRVINKQKFKKIKSSSNGQKEDLEDSLNKALVAYKCNNCSKPLQMLISYPVVHRVEDKETGTIFSSKCPFCSDPKETKFNKDIAELSLLHTEDIADECKCLKCQCNKKTDDPPSNKKFENDMDDLITLVVAEIIDPTKNLATQTQKDDTLFPEFIPPVIPIPKLTHIDLDTTGSSSYQNMRQVPFKAILNLDLGDYGASAGYRRMTEQESTFPYRETENKPPHISYSEYAPSSGSGFKSDPQTIIVYQAPAEVKTLNVEEKLPEPKIEYNRYASPEPFLTARKIVAEDEYLKLISNARILAENKAKRNYFVDKELPTKPITPDGLWYYPCARPSQYFFAEPNVAVKQIAEKPQDSLPKYLKVIPRHDLELASSAESKVPSRVPLPPIKQSPNFCHNCGHAHSGGNFCTACGSPLIVISSKNGGSYCPRCPKETRQLNDW